MKWIALLTLLGCGDDDATSIDATPDAVDLAPHDPQPPAAPALPERPDMLPCPDGWAERATPSGTPYCHPFPDGRVQCTGATYQRPGDRGCVPVGPTCSGEFAEALPANAIYVRASSTAGDGTRARPFATLAEAIAIAPDGATIALSAGVHEADLTIRRDVAIVGACAAETTIRDHGEKGLELRDGARLSLRRTTLTSDPGLLIDVLGDSRLELHGVVLLSNDASALRVHAGSLLARELLVRGPVNGASGISVQSECDIADAVIEIDSAGGVRSIGGLRLDRIAIVPLPGTTIASGVLTGAGGLFATRIAVFAESGFIVSGSTPSLVEDAFVLAGSKSPRISMPTTIAATRAELRVSRAFLGHGLTGVDSGLLELVDVVLNDTLPPVNHPGPSGIGVSRAELHLERVSIDTAQGVQTNLSRISGSDLIIEDVQMSASSVPISVAALDSTIDLTRFAVRGGTSGGLMVAGGRATVRDATIEDVAEGPATPVGIAALNGSRLTLERARVARAHLAAGLVAVGAGTRIVASDVALEDLLAIGAEISYARGIDAENEAVIEADRVVVRGSRGHAAVALHRGELTLRDATLEDSVACASDCGGHPFGVAIGAYDARVAVDGFLVRRAELCAVHLALAGEIDLARGAIEGSGAALCVGVDGYDLDRLTHQVTISGNERNLDSVRLPVPTPLPPIELEAQ